MLTNTKTFLKSYAAIGVAISLLAIYQTQQQTQALFKVRTRYKWVILMTVFLFNVIAGLYLVLRRDEIKLPVPRFKISLHPLLRGFLSLVLLILPLFFLWYARLDFFGRGMDAFFRLLWMFWWLALVQTAGIKLMMSWSWPVTFSLALLSDGILFQSYGASLAVTQYPFSMGWSEASRYYYASLPFSKAIYGISVPLSIMHGTRYFLQAIPFLVSGLPLWVHRLWQVLLWLGITGLTSWLLVRRVRPKEWKTGLMLGGWFFLYIFQGAVYYHLQVCVILVLLGVSSRHPWRSLIAVLVASFWAGMSRLNWYPVPAMLAITLYLLEESFSSVNHFWRYIAKPALWGVSGLVFALLGQAFYIAISGDKELSAFASSLHSPLLWYRWFPSATNALGIIPGILLVSAPLFVLIFQALRRRLSNLHPLRWFGLLAMLLILFAGGLVVSTKIGGGGDLHNMDAYMVLLAFIATYCILQRVEPETAALPEFHAVSWPAIACMLIVPVAFSLLHVGRPFAYNGIQAEEDLSTLRKAVQSYSKSGEVLFMYERHLLTFGMIPSVPLVPDYEVLTLMEMAISDNQPYLDRYYSDLANHRFSAIVALRQNLGVATGDFIEESNVWNARVGQPLLCQYKPVLTLTEPNIQVFVPRAKPCTDFPPAQ